MVQDTARTRSAMRWARQAHSPRRDGPAPRRWPRIMVSLVMLAAALSAPSFSPAAAQPAAACAIPDQQTAAAVPVPSATTPAPIVIAPVRRGVGTPVADQAPPAPAATPVPTPDPLVPLTAELTAVARALAACLSNGDAELVSTLATERYLGQLYGGDTPLPRDDYLALAAELDPISTVIRTVQNVAADGDDRATAEVTSVVGRQLLVSRWSFTLAPAATRSADESRWQVDQEAPLPFDPPANAAAIVAVIEDYQITLDQTAVPGPSVVLSGRNSAGQDHEMLVLRLDGATTTADLLRGAGPGLPAGIAYIGQATVPAAGQADLVLVDLEPGAYTVVCFFLTSEGVPHLALGMEASFTVEE